jgi:putative colanic acid biosynthesis acetyltransferase WcaB
MSEPSPWACLKADWTANQGNPKGRCVTAFFRTAQAAHRCRGLLSPIRWIVGLSYRISIEWILGIEIPWKTRIGPGLRVEHGQGLVINDGTVIGRNCRIRHGVTLGNRPAKGSQGGGCPILGDDVELGVHAIVIGPVRIGHRARIGAGAVVLTDVPDQATAVGNPARVLSPADNQKPSSHGL